MTAPVTADQALIMLAAAAILLLAHLARAVRWALLFSPTELTRRFNLLLGLSLGYAANAVVPWRIGELLRAWFVSRRESVRFSYVAASVAGERLSDLVVVALLSAVLFPPELDGAWRLMTWLPALAALLLVALCLCIHRLPKARRWAWAVASLFNDRIRISAVDFIWSLSELVVGGSLLRPRYLATTVLMWGLYLSSYAVVSLALGTVFRDTTLAMLGAPLSPVLTLLQDGRASATLNAGALLAFTLLPVLLVLVYGGLKQWPAIFRLVLARRRYGWYSSRAVSGGARNRFKAEAEYEYFLTSLFSGDNKVASTFGLEALSDSTVHRLYAGGSDAITALVEHGGSLVIRKFATGPAAEKLQLQEQWLTRQRVAGFPLVEVLGGTAKPSVYYYDMPLVVPANDFYDFIHSNPVESSQQILHQVLEKVSAMHGRHLMASTPKKTVEKYLQTKAVDNARTVLQFARTLLSGDAYQINGKDYSLSQWDRLLDPEWLAAQVHDDASSVIHGDLTIENIIVAPNHGVGWYIIDPNPDNVFNSPLIDWAKMLQSLHLGYEGMNRNYSCVIDGDTIRLAFTRSQAYTQLHQFLESWLQRRLSEDALREAYFHELINYLRLVPYKIRQNPKKGVAFFACTSVLLNEYTERWT